MNNLDYIAAKSGHDILVSLDSMDKKELEKLINDVLLVLHGDGVYACILYLYARDKKKTGTADKIVKTLLGAAKNALEIKINSLEPTPEDALNLVNKIICNKPDTLFLVKDLWERTLVYARYEAKAKVKK